MLSSLYSILPSLPSVTTWIWGEPVTDKHDENHATNEISENESVQTNETTKTYPYLKELKTELKQRSRDSIIYDNDFVIEMIDNYTLSMSYATDQATKIRCFTKLLDFIIENPQFLRDHPTVVSLIKWKISCFTSSGYNFNLYLQTIDFLTHKK